MKIDLHVHSKFSERPSTWLLNKIGCSESYTDPSEIYRIARQRGMDLVTIADHNKIAGCLEIAHLPGTFMSSELTTYFPDDNCKLHVLVHDITEAQFRDLNQARENVFDLVDYCLREGIHHALAHPFYAVNDRLTLDHFEKCVLLFKVFEMNGNQDTVVNQTLEAIFAGLSAEDIDRLAEKHGIEPPIDEPWRKAFQAGSDDHSSLNIANTYTELAGAERLGDFLRGVREGAARTGSQAPPTPLTMAHHLYGVAYQFYLNKFDLQGYHDYNLLMRFLDRMLQMRERETPRVWARLYSRWRSYRAGARGEPDARCSMTERLQYEAEKTVTRDAQLTAILNQGLAVSREPDQHWFRFVNQITNQMLGHLARHTVERLMRGNPFDLFHTIGSSGALYTLLAPYFVAYSMYSRNRRMSEEARRRFGDAEGGVEPRVGHFTDTFEEVNGVARTLNRQVELARQTGKQLTMITCTTADDQPPYAGGVRYFRAIDILQLPEYEEQRIFIPPLLEMLQFCYEQDFTHIHAATPGPIGLVGLAASRIMKLPFYTTYHTAMPQYAGVLTDDPGIEDLVWRGMLWFYQQADAIFSPSRATAQELIDRGIDESKIRIMPRGVDAKRFHPDRAADAPALPEGLRLLYVGRVSKEKNLPLLVRAYKRLLREHKDLQLIVVGDGPYLEEMRRALNDTPSHFTGYLEGDELTGVYAACDAFVFPSTTDTFGNVVLEAQASGLPIVVTDQGGPQENLLPGRTGLIVEGNSEEALFRGMRELVSDRERLAKLGREARAYAATRDFDKAFDEYWQLYQPREMEPAPARAGGNGRHGDDVDQPPFDLPVGVPIAK